MADMTRKEYWDEIRSIRDSLKEEWKDERADYAYDGNEWLHERLHQDIDGHQWIIYNAYNLDVLRFTDNEDAYIDNFGEWPADSDLSRIHTLAAFEAMRTDVQDGLDMDDFEDDDDED